MRDQMSSYDDGQYQEELGCADPEHNKKCHQKQQHSSDQQVGQLRLDSWKVLAQENIRDRKLRAIQIALMGNMAKVTISSLNRTRM